MEYDKIEKDFIVRTKNLIENYKGDYEVTLLINCCIGLLVLPKEKHLNSIPDITIKKDEETWGLSRKKIATDDREENYKLRNVIRKIRNGICHFNIKTIPDELGVIERLEISDRSGFNVSLTVKDLRVLTNSIAGHVLGS